MGGIEFEIEIGSRCASYATAGGLVLGHFTWSECLPTAVYIWIEIWPFWPQNPSISEHSIVWPMVGISGANEIAQRAMAKGFWEPFFWPRPNSQE